MALLQKGVALAAGRMPKMISPRVHSALDYAVAGSFLLMGALLLEAQPARRHRIAAMRRGDRCGQPAHRLSGRRAQSDSLLHARADRHGLGRDDGCDARG